MSLPKQRESKDVSPMGVDGMIKPIHDAIHARAHARDEVWCEHRTHPSRKPGKACRDCVRQTALWESWVRSLGDRVVRGEWRVKS